jgi:hypothetical protein
LIAKTLQKFGVSDRKIWMYDTYEGMSEPSEEDKDVGGAAAHEIWEKLRIDNKSGWCVSNIEEVKENIRITGYTFHQFQFIQGKVESTIPKNIPSEGIALLRLDTDWYESTKHELIHLYPHLVQKGVFIIDDYGHWVGAKKALDEYLLNTNQCLFLSKVDYTARIAIKA